MQVLAIALILMVVVGQRSPRRIFDAYSQILEDLHEVKYIIIACFLSEILSVSYPVFFHLVPRKCVVAD